eukprot:3176030-Pleurochrysis_carterae.AAC.1
MQVKRRCADDSCHRPSQQAKVHKFAASLTRAHSSPCALRALVMSPPEPSRDATASALSHSLTPPSPFAVSSSLAFMRCASPFSAMLSLEALLRPCPSFFSSPS